MKEHSIFDDSKELCQTHSDFGRCAPSCFLGCVHPLCLTQRNGVGERVHHGHWAWKLTGFLESPFLLRLCVKKEGFVVQLIGIFI